MNRRVLLIVLLSIAIVQISPAVLPQQDPITQYFRNGNGRVLAQAAYLTGTVAVGITNDTVNLVRFDHDGVAQNSFPLDAVHLYQPTSAAITINPDQTITVNLMGQGMGITFEEIGI